MKANAKDDMYAQIFAVSFVGIMALFVIFILPWIVVAGSYMMEWLPTIPYSIDGYWDWVLSFGPEK